VQVGNGAVLYDALSEERPAHSTGTEEITLWIYRHERGPRLVEIEAGGREDGICRFGIEGRAIFWIASRNAKYSIFQTLSWFREWQKRAVLGMVVTTVVTNFRPEIAPRFPESWEAVPSPI
jgi:hypothetical protein